jgi:hypothetical protein
MAMASMSETAKKRAGEGNNAQAKGRKRKKWRAKSGSCENRRKYRKISIMAAQRMAAGEESERRLHLAKEMKSLQRLNEMAKIESANNGELERKTNEKAAKIAAKEKRKRINEEIIGGGEMAKIIMAGGNGGGGGIGVSKMAAAKRRSNISE